MVFNSYIFLLAFLPVFLLLYFLLGRLHSIVSKSIIIVAGIIFYVYAGWEIALILAISLLVNYILSLTIAKIKNKKLIVALTIVLNVGILLYFKYLNFAIEIINTVAKQTLSFKDLILPLGISFFTFQQIMYVVSVGKGESKTSVLDYLCYILYFPKLVMGPLMEPTDFFSQLNDPTRKKINWDNLAGGLKTFSFGLFKKLLLADTFAKAVAWGFANYSVATAGDLFLVMLFYTFQIYFDFSGYSDMAVGIAKMMNFDLPFNFNSPYKATSIRDFWKRWHMSLTGFFTKYVYFPLGGSKKGHVRTYVNIMIIFLISGIWHGASLTFVLWGFLHGLVQVIERLFKKSFNKLSEVVRWGYTFFTVNILWLLFRADSVSTWKTMLTTMFHFENMAISDGLINAFLVPEISFLMDVFKLATVNAVVRGFFSMLLFTLAAFIICLIPENNHKKIHKTNVGNMIISAIVLIWSVLCLSAESVFLYFNF